MNFHPLIMHVSGDPGVALQFNVLTCFYRSNHGAVDDDMRDLYYPFDDTMVTQDQRTGFVTKRSNIARNTAVYAYSPVEFNIPMDVSSHPDKRIDLASRLACFLVKHFLSFIK